MPFLQCFFTQCNGEVTKALPVVRHVTHGLFVCVDDVVGLELLATTLAYKHSRCAAKVCAG